MKCQIIISMKNKKNGINLSSSEFANSMVSVNFLYQPYPNLSGQINIENVCIDLRFF